MIDNLSPAKSARIYDHKMQWKKASSAASPLYQALSYFTSFCEEVEARYIVAYSPEGQIIFLMVMLYCKLPDRVMKTELNKAMSANKTITKLLAELTEKPIMAKSTENKVNIVSTHKERRSYSPELNRPYEKRNTQEQVGERSRNEHYYTKPLQRRHCTACRRSNSNYSRNDEYNK